MKQTSFSRHKRRGGPEMKYRFIQGKQKLIQDKNNKKNGYKFREK